MQMPDDHSLLKAARTGDKEALESLLLRHQDRIYRFGMKFCRHPQDAEDVLQDTLLAMAKSIRNFQGRSSLSTWLYTVARNFCIKKRRKSKFAPKVVKSLEQDLGPDIQALTDPAKRPDDAAAGLEVKAALESAIQDLDPDYREALVLRDVEGLSAREVAEILEISVAAVKSRLHRARLNIRERIAPLLGIGKAAETAVTASCPDILITFSKHLEDEISADLCAEMEQHVAGCDRCRGTCDSLKRTLALCKTSISQKVPDPVQESVRTALREFLNAKA